jgi:hypothetical protein
LDYIKNSLLSSSLRVKDENILITLESTLDDVNVFSTFMLSAEVGILSAFLSIRDGVITGNY